MKPHIKKVNGLWECEGFKGSTPDIALYYLAISEYSVPFEIVDNKNKCINLWHKRNVRHGVVMFTDIDDEEVTARNESHLVKIISRKRRVGDYAASKHIFLTRMQNKGAN